MSVEENKAVMRRIIDEIWNKGDMTTVDEHVAANWVYQSPLGFEFKGPEGYKQFVTMFRTIFPDLHGTIDNMVAEGDKMAALLTLRGTFKGNFGNIEPTGKQLNLTFAYFFRFEGGKEVEALPFFDTLAFYQQLGISPPGQ